MAHFIRQHSITSSSSASGERTHHHRRRRSSLLTDNPTALFQEEPQSFAPASSTEDVLQRSSGDDGPNSTAALVDAGTKDALAWIAADTEPDQEPNEDKDADADEGSDRVSELHKQSKRQDKSSNSSLDVPKRPPLETRSSSASKFQSAARKISAARILSRRDVYEPRTPGIDARKVDLPDLHCEAVIQTVDCSKQAVEFGVYDATSLRSYLDRDRPDWAKLKWIHVNGLSWDVIKPLAIKYDLHPLAVEDLLHQSSVRSKVDYYRSHVFCNLISHRPMDNPDENDKHGSSDSVTSTSNAARKGSTHETPSANHLYGFHGSGTRNPDEERVVESNPKSRTNSDYGTASTSSVGIGSFATYTRKLGQAFANTKMPQESEERVLSHNTNGLSNRLNGVNFRSKRRRKTLNERTAARMTVAELTKDVKVHIHVEQLAIFLLRDNTIISFAQDPGPHPQISAIFDRISSSEELIRETEDASMVLQALLDVLGDQLLEIVDDFRAELTKLEAHVLSRPTMTDVRHLHVLSSQLLMLKSTIQPFQFVLQALRNQDEAKALATGSSRSDGEGQQPHKRVGFVSQEAKVYLGDVIDHVEGSLSSLDLFSDLAENLISFTLNGMSHASNAYLQGLSVLSVVFLPLTFLSGYFGQNFEDFPQIRGNVWYFWQIAIPTTFLTVGIFGWEYLNIVVASLGRVLLRTYHRILVNRRGRLD
ncbi:hypothetical protein ACM66B_000266 [Microbotryomycetes sp. NB124-2]